MTSLRAGSMMPIESSATLARAAGCHGLARSRPPVARISASPSAVATTSRGRRCQIGRAGPAEPPRRVARWPRRPAGVDDLRRRPADCVDVPLAGHALQLPDAAVSNVRPEPVVRSRTVDDTRTSPAAGGGHDARGDDDGEAGHLARPSARPRRRGRRPGCRRRARRRPARSRARRRPRRPVRRRSRRSRHRRCRSRARRSAAEPPGPAA